jgi:hypothetical protein
MHPTNFGNPSCYYLTEFLPQNAQNYPPCVDYTQTFIITKYHKSMATHNQNVQYGAVDTDRDDSLQAPILLNEKSPPPASWLQEFVRTRIQNPHTGWLRQIGMISYKQLFSIKSLHLHPAFSDFCAIVDLEKERHLGFKTSQRSQIWQVYFCKMETKRTRLMEQFLL